MTIDTPPIIQLLNDHVLKQKYTREDQSLMVENYHKATIPKGLSHEFITYRHRSLEKNM